MSYDGLSWYQNTSPLRNLPSLSDLTDSRGSLDHPRNRTDHIIGGRSSYQLSSIQPVLGRGASLFSSLGQRQIVEPLSKIQNDPGFQLNRGEIACGGKMACLMHRPPPPWSGSRPCRLISCLVFLISRHGDMVPNVPDMRNYGGEVQRPSCSEPSCRHHNLE